MRPDKSKLLEIYRVVSRVKHCDDKVHSLIFSGQLQMMWLSARGHEVLGAASGLALATNDYLVTYYRGLPEQLAKGMSMNEAWAEWFGKSTGNCKGRGGSIHVMDADVGIMSNSGIVGGGLPVADGLALSSQLKGDGRVTMVTFGDGAANEGAVHEALNLASIWKLPVVFLCHNNGYAETTAYAKTASTATLAERGASYNIPSQRIDGSDPVIVYDAVSDAVERARRGEGASFIEATAYRLMGHYIADDLSYVPPEELAAERDADAVPRFRTWLVAEGIATEDQLTAIDQAAREEVEAAYAFALASPDPSPDDLLVDVAGVGA